MSYMSDENTDAADRGTMLMEVLWKFVFAHAARFRSNKGTDGYGLWLIMKKHFEAVSVDVAWRSEVCQGGALYNEIAEAMADFPEHHDGKLNEVNHFVRQLNNVPRNNAASLIRFLQIALNLGQAQPTLGQYPRYIQENNEAFYNPYTWVVAWEDAEISQVVLDDFEREFIAFIDENAKGKLSM